jgi:hypothetical protein
MILRTFKPTTVAAGCGMRDENPQLGIASVLPLRTRSGDTGTS